MINVLELLKNSGITPRKASATNGGEYQSPCPSCGDHSRPKESDRFQVYPARNEGNGWYICRQCGIKGDSIQFLRDFEGKSYRDACHILGIEPKSKKQQSSGLQRMATPRPPVAEQEQFEPEEKDLPCSSWLQKAESFSIWCHEQLLKNKLALKWLADRGINRDLVVIYRLGYNPGNPSKPGQALYRPRKDWGLPEVKDEKTGKKKMLWLPLGWVIPLIDPKGRVIQLRIRRLDRDIKKFLKNMKYRVIPGSTVATMLIEPSAPSFVVVENGFDAMLVAQEAKGIAGAVTTWNAKAKPDAAATAILRKASCILLAQDYDKAGCDGAKWWKKHFIQSRRWPVAVGNDAGEAYALGEDLYGWIKAGLPLSAAPAPAPLADDGMINPGLLSKGEAEKTLSEKNEQGGVRWIELKNGMSFCVVDAEKEWNEQVENGEIVFSGNELKRLREATKNMNDDERLEAAVKVLEMKQVFGSAYIRRGESFA